MGNDTTNRNDGSAIVLIIFRNYDSLLIFNKGEFWMFEGKKAIVLGERDGVPGPAIAACMEAVGAEVIFTATECFV